MDLEAAKAWFIERFMPTYTAQMFAKRLNNVNGEGDRMSVDERKKLTQRRGNHARYDFQFLPTAFKLLVIPNTAEAEWLRGVIWYDVKNEEFVYMTSKRLDLFTELDR